MCFQCNCCFYVNSAPACAFEIHFVKRLSDPCTDERCLIWDFSFLYNEQCIIFYIRRMYMCNVFEVLETTNTYVLYNVPDIFSVCVIIFYMYTHHFFSLLGFMHSFFVSFFNQISVNSLIWNTKLVWPKRMYHKTI